MCKSNNVGSLRGGERVFLEWVNSAPDEVVDFDRTAAVDEEEYGEVIGAGNSPLTELVSIEGRPRASSFTSSLSSFPPDLAAMSAS